MLTVIPQSTRKALGRGLFRIHRVSPGAHLPGSLDTGLGGLGLIDDARLSPGLVVRMHEHRDDEIVSYLWKGKMRHTDPTGRDEVLSPGRLMVMNAGAGFSHEEAVPDVPVEMLQIFIRPRTSGLPPLVQFAEVDPEPPRDRWRWLVGPERHLAGGVRGSQVPDVRAQSGSVDAVWPPAVVRQEVSMFDRRLEPEDQCELPGPESGVDRALEHAWLYVISGEVYAAGARLTAGDALVASPGAAALITAASAARLVCFRIDVGATFTRAGSLSG